MRQARAVGAALSLPFSENGSPGFRIWGRASGCGATLRWRMGSAPKRYERGWRRILAALLPEGGDLVPLARWKLFRPLPRHIPGLPLDLILEPTAVVVVDIDVDAAHLRVRAQHRRVKGVVVRLPRIVAGIVALPPHQELERAVSCFAVIDDVLDGVHVAHGMTLRRGLEHQTCAVRWHAAQ